MQFAIDGQPASPSLADFTPSPMEVPELALRQRAADWATAHFAATGKPWPQNAPHLHQQLEAAGFRFSLVMVKRVLKWLKDQKLAFTVEKIGRVFLFKPVPVEPVTGRLPFVSRMSAEPERSKGEPERIRSGTEVEPQPNRSGTDPEPEPGSAPPVDLSKIRLRRKLTDAEILALGVQPCSEHEYRNLQIKPGGVIKCSVQIQSGEYCDRISARARAGAGVSITDSVENRTGNREPEDAGAGITPGGPLDSYRRRHGGRLPWETDPHVDSSSGGDPTTA